MTKTTREWLEKAESDFDVVELLRRSRKASRFDPICFHCHQCVEKYLKACLNEAGIGFTKTHDLAVLLAQAVVLAPPWSGYANAFSRLTTYAVAFRYPGSCASRKDAAFCYEVCARFRHDARQHLL